MRANRRTVLKGLPLAAAMLATLPAAVARADEAYIPRVGGEVTAPDFKALADLAQRFLNSFIGLKISVAEGEHDGLMAKEAGGLLILSMRGGDVELSFPSGYRKDGGRFFFDGFYNAIYVGVNAGVTGVHLVPARTMDVEATGKPVKEFSIAELAAKGG